MNKLLLLSFLFILSSCGENLKEIITPIDQQRFNTPAPTSQSDITITSVTSSNSNRNYLVGEEIIILVNFSRPVFTNTFAGLPFITLNLGPNTANALLFAGTGTNQLRFRFNVQAGDTTADLEYLDTMALSNGGGFIRSEDGVDVNLELPEIGGGNSLSDNQDIIIDSIRPVVTGVSISADTYRLGDVLTIEVEFSEAVSVVGMPRLGLNFTEQASSPAYALYNSGSQSSQLIFTYTVLSMDLDLDGIELEALIDLNSGSILDVASNPAELSLIETSFSSVFIDARPNVTLDSPHIINLANVADYEISGTCSDNGNDVDINIGGLLQSVVCIDQTWMAAFDVTSLANGLTNISVDHLTATTATDSTLKDVILPTISNVSIAAQTYQIGDVLNVIVEFSEPVIAVGTPRLTLNFTAQSNDPLFALYSSGDGTNELIFTYTINSGDVDSDGIELLASIDFNGGSLNDNAGNSSVVTLSNTQFPTVLIDAQPQVLINAPEPINLANQNNYLLSGTCSDNAAEVVITIGSLSQTIICSSFTWLINQDVSTLSDGLITITANHLTADEASVSVTKDVLPPEVTSILIADATYELGDELIVIVNYNEDVIVSGSPRIQLNFNEQSSDPIYAVYTSGSSSTALNFSYNIASGDVDLDGLDLIGPIDLDGGTLADIVTNPATVTLTTTNFPGALIDARPTVSINPPALINLANSANYTLSGSCSDNGTVVTITIGGIVQNATCTAQVWSLTQDVSSIADGDVIITANHASALLIEETTTKDVVLPSITQVIMTDATYSVGDMVTITLSFDEDVIIIGNPRIELNFTAQATTPLHAEYVSGSGSNQLLFSYIVASGDQDDDGIDLITPIDLNGGTITDMHENNASLVLSTTNFAGVLIDGGADVTIDAPLAAINSINQDAFIVSGTCSGEAELVMVNVGGLTQNTICSSASWTLSFDTTSLMDGIITITANHLTADEAILTTPKDATIPEIDNVSISSGTYSIGQTLTIDVSFNESVVISGLARIELSFDSQSTDPIYALYASGSGSNTLSFTYTVASGDNDSNGIDLLPSIDLNGSSIIDTASNPAALAPLTTIFPAVLIDSAAPFITSFVEPVDGTYGEGGQLLFQVNFSEDVNITGVPSISIDLGGSIVQANYIVGSGSSGLEFSYTIQSGDVDNDGINVTSTLINLNGGSVVATSDGDPSALSFNAHLDSLSGVFVNTSSGIVPPDQVTGVGAAPTVNNDELSVVWSTPSNNGTTIIDYNVQYRQEGDSTWLNLSPAPLTNSAVIDGLTSGVVYEIRVAANNGLLGAYSAVSTAEIFDILSLDPVAWLSSTNITDGGLEPNNGDLIDRWEELTGAGGAAVQATPSRRPVYQTNIQNGLPAVRFDDKDRPLHGSFSRSIGTNLTFVVVGQFDNGSTDKALFEFRSGESRGFFIDRRYAGNTFFSPQITTGSFALWRIEDTGGSAIVTENGSTIIFNGATTFNTDFTGAGNYTLGDDDSGGNRLNGFVGEFLIFDRALNASEISTLENYLINKWGL